MSEAGPLVDVDSVPEWLRALVEISENPDGASRTMMSKIELRARVAAPRRRSG